MIKRLYRIPERGKIAGVCAGLADSYKLSLRLVRIVFIIGCFLWFPFGFIVYILLILLLPIRILPPEEGKEGRDRKCSRAGDEAYTFQDADHSDGTGKRLQKLEERLAHLEAVTVDEDRELRRKFRDLQ